MPGLQNHSLISIPQLFEAGCQVKFTKTKCIIEQDGKDLIRGIKNNSNGLWYVPIINARKQHTKSTTHQTNNVYHISTIPDTMKFLHQCLFSPTVDKLCKTIDNNKLIGFPNLTSKRVRKYLPESTATAKGHMNRTRKGISSITKLSPSDQKKRMEETTAKLKNQELNFNPPKVADSKVELFMCATISDQNDGTIYTNQTGSMPVPSLHGKRYHFVAYEY